MTTPLIYVAGPYTRPDPQTNTRKAIFAAQRLVEFGYAVFVPHLFHHWDEFIPGPYKQWMRLGMAVLERCDALVLLPGYSPGAEAETARMQELKRPVLTTQAAMTQGCLELLTYNAGRAPHLELATNIALEILARNLKDDATKQ